MAPNGDGIDLNAIVRCGHLGLGTGRRDAVIKGTGPTPAVTWLRDRCSGFLCFLPLHPTPSPGREKEMGLISVSVQD